MAFRLLSIKNGRLLPDILKMSYDISRMEKARRGDMAPFSVPELVGHDVHTTQHLRIASMPLQVLGSVDFTDKPSLSFLDRLQFFVYLPRSLGSTGGQGFYSVRTVVVPIFSKQAPNVVPSLGTL